MNPHVDAATSTGDATAAAPVVIRGGLLLTQDPAQPRLFGDVLVTDGRIAAVGVVRDDATARVIDATGKVVLPGFVDTHRHLWQGLFGLTAAPTTNCACLRMPAPRRRWLRAPR